MDKQIPQPLDSLIMLPSYSLQLIWIWSLSVRRAAGNGAEFG